MDNYEGDIENFVFQNNKLDSKNLAALRIYLLTNQEIIEQKLY